MRQIEICRDNRMAHLTVNDCFYQIRNGANIKQGDADGGYPITRIETISNDVFNRDRMGYAGITDLTKYESYVLEDGDLLMSHINSVQYLGRTVLYEKQGDEKIIHGMNLLVLKANRSIVKPAFARYAFYSPKFRQQLRRITKKSVNQASFTVADLKKIEIDVPSLEKQAHIVENLDKTKRILALRRQEIEVLDALIKARFVEMFGDPIINPRELPVSDLGHLSELITKGASPSWQGFSYTDDATQTLFVTSENVREGYIDISLPKYIEDGFNEKQRRSVLQKGDFLINIVGASIGRAAQFTLDCKANINQAVALVRIEDKRIRDGYLLVYLNSEKAQQMYNSMKSDTGRANLSLQDISNLSILLPPVEEQITFENFVTQVDKSKAAVQKSLDETQLLFNSLMQKYFG